MWSGLLVSIAGSQMQLWSLYWHIRTLSDQPVAVSGVGLSRFIPILIFSLIGGLVADRFNRRKVLFLTQSTMTLVAAALGLLTWLGVMQLWMIYALTAIQAMAAAFDGPARQAMMANLVPREHMPSAFSMNSIAMHVGAIVGPALSGVVISAAGQEWTYWINAISFFAVIIALALIGHVPQESTISADKKGFQLSAIGEGLRFVVSQPVILGGMIIDFFASFFSSCNTLLPYVVQDILHAGAVQYGWLSAAQSIGAVSVGLVFSQRAKVKRQGRKLVMAVIAFGLFTVIFGISRNFWLTLGALIMVGATDAVSTILRSTIRQLATPDALRGRMQSINQIFFMGGPQLGEIESGLVGQWLGIPATIVIGGAGCVAAAGLVAWRWPQLHRYDGTEAVPVSTSS